MESKKEQVIMALENWILRVADAKTMPRSEEIAILPKVARILLNNYPENIESIIGSKYYIFENDLEKHEIALVLPENANKLTLKESEVYTFIKDFENQTRQWLNKVMYK